MTDLVISTEYVAMIGDMANDDLVFECSGTSIAGANARPARFILRVAAP